MACSAHAALSAEKWPPSHGVGLPPYPQKIAVGSRSISSSKSSTRLVGGTRSCSWKRRFRSPPIQRPRLRRLRVAQPCDRKSRPLGAHVLAPRWAALNDRQVPGSDVTLHADLVADVFRDALLAPAPNSCHIEIGKTLRCHPCSVSASCLDVRFCRCRRSGPARR